MRTRLRRHAALLSLVAAAARVAVVMACWVALRPATSGRNSLPEPIRIAEVPGSSPQPQSPAPAPADPGPGPADVVPPPPLPDDDEDDDADDEDDGGDGDDGDDD